MPWPVAELLDELTAHPHFDLRPWGFMRCLDAPGRDLTVKYLVVRGGRRTSLQKHDHKDELLILLTGDGWAEAGGTRYDGINGSLVRIPPGTVHRVTGPLTYLEISTYDDGTDTIRLEDDYGREGAS